MFDGRALKHWIIGVVSIVLMCTSIVSHAENPFKLAEERQSGKFVLEFTTPKKDVYRDIEYIFKKSGIYENIIAEINKSFVFPENITVKFAAGDGPIYYTGKNTIQMSYDFILYLSELYLERYPKASDKSMMNFALRSTTFLFYHEAAHAFIDVFQLPIVGNEEVAADNLAVILAFEYSDDGFDVVMDSVELFDLLEVDNHAKYTDDDYWDEHALDAQRFYSILCLAYGKYPKQVMKVLKDVKNKKIDHFIQERGEYCADEYQRQLSGWSQLLSGHFRE